MSIGTPLPVSIPGLTVKDGRLYLPLEEFEYRESETWIAENTGFTWCRDGEMPENSMGVSWFACSEKHHACYEDAEAEALRYADAYGNDVMVRVKKIERKTTTLVLNPP
jgi:hypothetical protein